VDSRSHTRFARVQGVCKLPANMANSNNPADNEGKFFERGTTKEEIEGGLLPPQHPLTLGERSHVVKVLVGMIITCLSGSVASSDLVSLLGFINKELDEEFEVVSMLLNESVAGSSGGEKYPDPVKNSSRYFRWHAMVWCSEGLLKLVKEEGGGVLEGLEEGCGGVEGTCSWILGGLGNASHDKVSAHTRIEPHARECAAHGL